MQAEKLKDGKRKPFLGNSLTIKTKTEMKKNLFMVAAVALFAAVSCNDQLSQDVTPAGETVTFEASVDGADTKVSLEGKVSKWENGDKITIHNGTKGYEFSTTDAGTKATFSYTGADFAGEKFMAVYPSGNYTADVEAKTVTGIVIPDKQVLKAGTFPSDAAVSVAYSENESLNFKNAVAVLKFKVTGDDVKYGAFYADGGKGDLTGKYNLAYNNGEPVLTSVEAMQWVDFHMNDAVLSKDATYYLAVAPAAFATGFGISLNGVEVKKHTGAFTLERNHIYDLGTLEYVAPADPSTLSWGIGGDMTSWADGADIAMTLDGDWFVAENVAVEAGQAFKLRADGNWDVNRGAGGDVKPFALTAGTEIEVWDDGQDMTVAAGTYNFYLSKDCKKFKVEAVGGSETPEVDPTKYGLVGSFQGWDAGNPIAMELASDGWIVTRGVELGGSGIIKIVQDKSWNVSYGTSSVVVLEEGVETTLVTNNSQNMKVGKNGKFDVYFNPNAKKVKVECVDDYADIKVNITIDNKANWTPLYITLKFGDEVIADAEEVINNTYAVSGKYIGESLTYWFTSGSKKSEAANVTITKDGAKLTLEETVVKLYFELDTANAKQWWGNTSKIHVWGTGTSFDTSWPGTTMTSEGTYTWSVIVPSELVGKTINYLIHNGNGWQSNDSKVTIKAEGVTVKGSSIGVN